MSDTDELRHDALEGKHLLAMRGDGDAELVVLSAALRIIDAEGRVLAQLVTPSYGWLVPHCGLPGFGLRGTEDAGAAAARSL